MRSVFFVLLATAAALGLASADTEAAKPGPLKIGYRAWSGGDCKAFLYDSVGYCTSGDCKAYLYNSVGYCETATCKAILYNSVGYCS